MPSVTRLINIIARTNAMFRADRARKEGLDINQALFPYIIALPHRPGISQDQLASIMYLNKSNVTRHMASLEEKGYVERRQNDEDKRVINVYPTEKLEEIRAKIRAISKEWKEYILQDLSEEELAVLTELLSKVASRSAEYAEREVHGGESEE